MNDQPSKLAEAVTLARQIPENRETEYYLHLND